MVSMHISAFLLIGIRIIEVVVGNLKLTPVCSCSRYTAQEIFKRQPSSNKTNQPSLYQVAIVSKLQFEIQ